LLHLARAILHQIEIMPEFRMLAGQIVAKPGQKSRNAGIIRPHCVIECLEFRIIEQASHQNRPVAAAWVEEHNAGTRRIAVEGFIAACDHSIKFHAYGSLLNRGGFI